MRFNENGRVVFDCSGKAVYACGDTIGLGVYGEEEGERNFGISYGSDGGFGLLKRGEADSQYELTIAEQLEMADHMIALWQEFRASLISP